MIKRFFLRALKVIAALIAFYTFVALAMYLWYTYRYPSMDDFCANIPDKAAPELVLEKAQTLNLMVFDNLKEENRISVINHPAPFFRKACVLRFNNGQVSNKSVITAD